VKHWTWLYRKRVPAVSNMRWESMCGSRCQSLESYIPGFRYNQARRLPTSLVGNRVLANPSVSRLIYGPIMLIFTYLVVNEVYITKQIKMYIKLIFMLLVGHFVSLVGHCQSLSVFSMSSLD
jgi:hypothetical protein